MKTSEDLKQILERIDHRGYPAYKDTRGAYQFGTYILGIDHVQGDPFAAPSRLHIQVAGRAARIPGNLYDSKCKKMAVADYLLRNFAKQLERYSFQAHGSGKSGIIQVTRCGQEVLERTACEIEEKTGNIIVRFEVGFPARGRTIQAGELIKILYQYLPACVEKALYYKNMDQNAVKQAAELAVDQEYIREQLKKEGLIAFVADGSILPRESGVSQRPMKDAVPFVSPDSMKVTMKLPKEQERVKTGKISGAKKKPTAGSENFTEKETTLFDRLKELRREIAKEEKVPPYIVFSDRTLVHMCLIKPKNKEEMLKVSGVGEYKFEKYGERFMNKIRKST